MKKLISIFTIFISLFVFYNGFMQYSTIEKERLVNIQDTIAQAENKEAVLLDISVPENREVFYVALLSFVHEQGDTAIIRTSSQDKDMIDYDISYLYTRQPEVSLKYLSLDNDSRLDFQNASTAYYSSDLNDACFNHIRFLDRNLNKTYNGIYEVHPFDEIKNDTAASSYFLYIMTDNKEALINEVEASKLSSYLSEGWQDTTYHPIEPTTFDGSLLYKVLIVCIITVLLLIVCDVLKRQKEVMIRKLHGMSSGYIVMKMYGRQFLSILLCYVLTSIFAYFLFVKSFHEGVYAFIKLQVLYFLLFAALQLLVILVIFVLTYFVQSIHHLKKPAYLKVVRYTNILLKIAVLLLLVQPLISFTEQGMKETKNLYYVVKNKDVLRNQFYVNSISEDSVHDFSFIEAWIKDYFEQHGGIYQDFISKDAVDMDGIPMYEEPYVMVNITYLKDYDVVDEANEFVDIEKLEEETLLVPTKYKEEGIDASLYCESRSCNVLYVKNGMKLSNHDPLTAAEYGWTVKDPIISVQQEIGRWNYPYMFLSYADEKEIMDIKADLRAAGLEENVFFNTTNTMYDTVFEMVLDRWLNAVFLLSVYFIVILAFLYQNIFLYFIEHKERFALNYIHGYSFMERHGEMLCYHIMIYIIPLTVGWFYFQIPFLQVIVFTSCAVLFEVLAMLILTKRFEKCKIAEILKGE